MLLDDHDPVAQSVPPSAIPAAVISVFGTRLAPATVRLLAFLGMTPTPSAAARSLFFAAADEFRLLGNAGTRRIISP